MFLTVSDKWDLNMSHTNSVLKVHLADRPILCWCIWCHPFTLSPAHVQGRLCGLVDRVLDHRSLPPEFESWHGCSWRLVHLWLRFITFEGPSAHLTYRLHRSGRKASIFILHMYSVNDTLSSAVFFSWIWP